MSEWVLEYWKLALTVVSFLLTYPVYRVIRGTVRLTRNQLALEACKEDLRITTDRMARQKAHLDAYGIESSSPSTGIPSTPSQTSAQSSTQQPMN